jgi:hypothetical protein
MQFPLPFIPSRQGRGRFVDHDQPGELFGPELFWSLKNKTESGGRCRESLALVRLEGG